MRYSDLSVIHLLNCREVFEKLSIIIGILPLYLPIIIQILVTLASTLQIKDKSPGYLKVI